MSLATFNRKEGMKLEIVTEGALSTDGTEQELIVDSVLSHLFGFIDLSEMTGGDTVVIRQYVDLDGGYKVYADETYSGIQSQPAVYITPTGSNSKVKITFEQTAGSYKQFAYQFSREV